VLVTIRDIETKPVLIIAYYVDSQYYLQQISAMVVLVAMSNTTIDTISNHRSSIVLILVGHVQKSVWKGVQTRDVCQFGISASGVDLFRVEVAQ
jgi:hypothetical protein